MSDKDLDKDKLIELINSVKTYSGCDEVEIVGSNKTLEILMVNGFPLYKFKCKEVPDLDLDESKIYIIPIDGDKKVKIYG